MKTKISRNICTLSECLDVVEYEVDNNTNYSRESRKSLEERKKQTADRGRRNLRTNGDYFDHRTAEIGKNIQNSSIELWKLGVTR